MSAEIMIELASEILRPFLDYGKDRDDRLLRVHDLADRARAVAGGSESVLGLGALVLRVEGRCTEAIAAYTARLQAHPTSVTYRQGLAVCLTTLGRSVEALPLLQESIKLDRGASSKHHLYGNLGHALVRLGRSEEAITWLRAAKEHSSGFSPQINLWLAVAYAHSGNVQAARREFREASGRLAIYTPFTLRNLRHRVWANGAIAEEVKREIDGLAIAGMSDHTDEDADTGLPITEGLRSTDWHAPTPLGAPGAAVIRTPELSNLIKPADLIDEQGRTSDDVAPIVISTVCSNCFDIAFPGATYIPERLQWAAAGSPMDEERRRSLKAWVDGLLQGNESRRLITISWSAEWWNARNLAINLASLGFPNVAWYRGGLEAWDAAGLAVARNRGRSIAEYDEAIRRDPSSAAMFFNRGLEYRRMGDVEHAISDFTEAIRLDSKFARAFLNRGLVYAYGAKRDLDRAIADFDEAIRLDPKFPEAFNFRGFAYYGKADPDRAIADYDEAIRLDPKVGVVLANRSLAYLAKADLDRTIADASAAIRLQPKLAFAFNTRAAAYQARGEFDRAIADYTEAIGLAPKLAAPYYGRGAHLYGGALAKAQADFKVANEFVPKSAYAAIWLDIAERRGNLPSRLQQTSKQLDMTAWPAPVVRLFLGELTPARALGAANDDEPAKKRKQVCEVNFFSGELALLQSAKEDAARLFDLVAHDCPNNVIEREGANAELRALRATP